MKKIVLAISILATLFSCRKNEKPTRVWSNSEFVSAANDSTKTTQSLLDSILPSVLEKAKIDTTDFYFGQDDFLDDEPFREIAIAKFIDDSKIVATEIHFRDSVVNFFVLDDRKWKKIGSEKTDSSIFTIESDDLDLDGNHEIITSTSPNMNGNRWLTIYRFSDQSKTIKYAGSFSTDYRIDKKRKQIEVEYEGSWYMDSHKTLYRWRGERLVPAKQIVLAHQIPVKDDGKLFFEYYESDPNERDELKLKLREVYEGNEKQKQLWDHFFDRK